MDIAYWILILAIFVLVVGYCIRHSGDVAWLPTPQELIETMLDMAIVTSADYVVDLGSGDGRIVIAAAKRGAMALGIECRQGWVEFARHAAAKEGVSERATFEKADILGSDFSKATVLTLFLLSHLNIQLRSKILDMKPGTRIVSNTFDLGDWQPDKITQLERDSDWVTVFTSQDERCNPTWRTAYLWIVPAQVDGTWTMDSGKISFDQKFQKITGILTIGTEDTKLTGKLDGVKISFNAGGTEYTGTVCGNTISGMCAGGCSWKCTRCPG
jgi:phospholipid N-methyltransferase